MADFWYHSGMTKLVSGTISFNDVRVILVMTNTTSDTEKDVDFIADFSTLDEYDGANYARKALGSEAVSDDDSNNRTMFDAADTSWTALGAGARQAQAMLYYQHVTNDADSVPLMYCESGGFPFTGNGGNVPVTFNASGLGYIAT